MCANKCVCAYICGASQDRHRNQGESLPVAAMEVLYIHLLTYTLHQSV